MALGSGRYWFAVLLCMVLCCLAVAIAKNKPYDYKDYSYKENSINKGNRVSTYSNLYHYMLKRKKPWMLLPNTDKCFQQKCTASKDCCRFYNICDVSANVCIDCWYGYTCSSNADCCERFPVCVKTAGGTVGRCSKE